MKRGNFSFFNKAENAFLIIGVIFGILFLLITPPFQVSDEYNHFFRSYQISEGRIIPERQQSKIGGLIPKSLVTTSQSVSTGIPFHPEIKQKPEKIFSLLNLPLESHNKIFVHFPNTSLYSPIPYLPQATGIALGKIIGFSPITLMYMGRICNLLVWVLLGYLSIKVTPIFKWLFFLLALTPMSLFQAASLSADGVTNSLSFLLIAIFLNHGLVESKQVNKIGIFIIILLSILLSLAKQAYLPLALLFLIIPPKKLGMKRYFTIFALLLLLCLLAVIAWSFITKEMYIPLQPNVSPSKQLVIILNNPLNFFALIFDTFILKIATYIKEFIGTLGWLDTELPKLYIFSYAFVLLFVAMASKKKDIVISYKQKMVILITLILNVIFLYALMYLSWTSVGGNIIEGIQGRYFIPIAPLVFLLLYNQQINFNIKKFGLVVACYSVFSETFTAIVLLHRYYL